MEVQLSELLAVADSAWDLVAQRVVVKQDNLQIGARQEELSRNGALEAAVVEAQHAKRGAAPGVLASR